MRWTAREAAISNRPCTFVGFDSAWADNPKNPGAICALTFDGARFADFVAPGLVGFAGALALVGKVHRPDRPTSIAIDQPTIVRNLAGMRAAERAVASVIIWSGGGVQPANRGRIGMFDDLAPIWPFLQKLGAIDDPEASRGATQGLHVMEVYPALALLSLDARFGGPKRRPRYNPDRRKTFRREDWTGVVDTAAAEATRFGVTVVRDWLQTIRDLEAPRKADQDKLDAVICLLVAMRWRLAPRADSIMIGDLETGYIVAPVVDPIRQRLAVAAARVGVAIA